MRTTSFIAKIILLSAAGMLSIPAALAAGENMNSSTDKFLIIVGNPLYQTGLITTALDAYQQDLQNEGWTTTRITVNKNFDATADYVCPDETDLKNVIKDYYNQGYDGWVIIGSPSDMPTAWWKNIFSDPPGSECASDLYYADMDDWTAQDGEVYVSYDAAGNFVGGNFGPEMFFGRISAGPNSSSLEEEAAKVVFYLEKIHAYRVNGSNLTPEQRRRAFVFRDDDWSHKLPEFESYHEATSNIDIVLDRRLTNGQKLGQLLEEGCFFGELWTHSETNCFTLSHLATLDIKVNYINLDVCGALNYSEPNIGAAFIFDTDHTCNVIGAIGSWAIGLDFLAYAQLNNDMPIGIVLQGLANRQISAGEVGWPKGDLVGDPLLKHTMNVTNRPPRIVNDLRNLTAVSNQLFSTEFVAEDPEGDPMTVSIEDLPPDMSWQGNTLSWTPSSQDEGGFRVLTVKAVDNHNNCYREEFDIYVPGTESFANGDFEAGSGGAPSFWNTQFTNCETNFRWEPAGVGHNGTRCVSIAAANSPDDACWIQRISGLRVGSEYLLQGWIKGNNIVSHEGSIGANMCLEGTWEFSQAGFGTFDWQFVQLKFKAESESVTIGCRLGYWTSIVTGQAWFDDIILLDLTPTLEHNFVFLADEWVKIDQNKESHGHIHSNGKIEFGRGAPGVHTGNLSACGDITIRDRNTIIGNAIAGDDLYLFGSANVTGTATDHAPVAAIPIPAPSFSVGGPNKTVTENGTLTLLPGSYGKVKVNRNGTLFMSSGDYFMNILDTEPSAKLSCDVNSGPVKVHVMTELDLEKRVQVLITGTGAATDRVQFVTMQGPKVDIGENAIIRGAIIAPHTEVHFSDGCKFRGSVCARSITLDPSVKFQFHTSYAPFPKPSEMADSEIENVSDQEMAGSSFVLEQNYPNPFNPTTNIRFALPEAVEVRLVIYNSMGQVIRTLVSGTLKPGWHSVTWDATDDHGMRVASGVYLYQLKTGNHQHVGKMNLAR